MWNSHRNAPSGRSATNSASGHYTPRQPGHGLSVRRCGGPVHAACILVSNGWSPSRRTVRRRTIFGVPVFGQRLGAQQTYLASAGAIKPATSSRVPPPPRAYRPPTILTVFQRPGARTPCSSAHRPQAASARRASSNPLPANVHKVACLAQSAPIEKRSG